MVGAGASGLIAAAGVFMLPALTAIVPAYRDLDLLRDAVPALLASEGVAIDVLLVNNDPAQDVAAYAASLGDPRVRCIEMGRNAGFAAAINAGIQASSAPWVLIGNDDLVVTPGFLATLVAFLDAHPRAAAAQGKLVRTGADGTTVIDSAGIGGRRSRGCFDIGQGAADAGQFDRVVEVFGCTGAAMLCRRAALDDVAPDGRVLDDGFFMYKEDVDLAWRLRHRGWECWYVPEAVAVHSRTSRSASGRGYVAAAGAHFAGHRTKAAHVRIHSLKNQWLTLVKNEPLPALLRDAPWILGREAAVVVASFLVSPADTGRALLGFARALPRAARERRAIQSRSVVPPADLRRWFLS
jgi:GT2 family glycosyltransferase